MATGFIGYTAKAAGSLLGLVALPFKAMFAVGGAAVGTVGAINSSENPVANGIKKSTGYVAAIALGVGLVVGLFTVPKVLSKRRAENRERIAREADARAAFLAENADTVRLQKYNNTRRLLAAQNVQGIVDPNSPMYGGMGGIADGVSAGRGLGPAGRSV